MQGDEPARIDVPLRNVVELLGLSIDVLVDMDPEAGGDGPPTIGKLDRVHLVSRNSNLRLGPLLIDLVKAGNFVAARLQQSNLRDFL